MVAVQDLPTDTTPIGIGFNTFSRALGMSDNEVLNYRTVANMVATFIAGMPDKATLCPSRSNGTAACAESFALTFTKRAWRRPLEAPEQQTVKDIVALATSSLDFNESLSAAVRYALLSPYFLFRSELGEDGAKGGTTKLSPYEVASLLSFAALRTTPSDELMALADANKLNTRADLAKVVQGWLADGKLKAAGLAEDFANQWLEIGEAGKVNKDPMAYPKFSESVYKLMQSEFNAFVSTRVWDSGSNLPKLFSDKSTLLNTELANYYGLPDPKTAAFREVDLIGAKQPRSGVLTLGAFTASRSRAADTFVQGRGKTVGTMVMCLEIPAPDPEVLAKAALDSPVGMSHRQFLERQLRTPGCTACHQLMDPPGLALEVFDGAGVYRSNWSKDEKVDASGTYDATDIAGTFTDIEDLSLKMSKSDQVSRCFAQQSFVYLLGESLTAEDECTLANAYDGFKSGGYAIPQLWTTLLSSDAILFRKNIN